MSDYFDPKLVEFISTGGTLNPQGRAAVFENMARAFSVIPVRNYSKEAKFRNWKEACQARQVFNPKSYAKANAGVACGPASGVLVLDVDDHAGFIAWTKAHGLQLPLPETFTVRTGKGAHFYYQYPGSADEYRNRSKRGARSIGDKTGSIFDIRGFGGYVLAPGSIHPETRKPYLITRNCLPAEAPRWLLDLAQGKEIPPISQTEPTADDMLEELEVPQQEITPINVNDLPISPELRQIITTSYPVGMRSEKEWAAITGMLEAGLSSETIHAVFESEAIGEKHHEHGDGRFKRLDAQIAKAKEQVLLGSRRHEGLRCYSIGEIMEADTQIEFLVQDMLIKGDVFMLLGDGGVGKSLLGLHLALNLADPPENGFLGRFAIPAPARTLILQSENSLASFTNRMLKIYGHGKVDRQHPLESIPQAVKDNVFAMGNHSDVLVSGNFQDKKFRAGVNELLGQYQPELLFMDPLISFHNGDENDNSGMRRVLDTIKDMAVVHNLSVGIVHHTGKRPGGSSQGSGRGASSIGNWSRNSFELVRRQNSSLVLKHVKANDLELLKPLELELGPDLCFTVKGEMPTNADSKDALILKALKTLPSSSVTQVALAQAVVETVKSSGGSTSVSTATRWIQDSSVVIRDNASKLYTKATKGQTESAD